MRRHLTVNLQSNPEVLHLVLLAAGSGLRAIESDAGIGTNGAVAKQFVLLHGSSSIVWCLTAWQNAMGVESGLRCLVLPAGQSTAEQDWETISSCSGGDTRAESTANGLQRLREMGATEADWVMVHDSARPCIRATDIRRLNSCVRRAAMEKNICGGALAVPVTDTLRLGQKSSEDSDWTLAADTQPRDCLWRMQTPQMFRLGQLRDALEQAIAGKRAPTDEIQAMAWVGHDSLLLQGSTDNVKISFPGDFAIASAILQERTLLHAKENVLDNVSNRGNQSQ